MAIKNSWASGEVLTAADLTDTFKGVYINAQTGTSYTFGTADGFVTLSNASGGTATIPANATAAFNTGAVIGVMNAGTAGSFTIGTAAGVTLNAVSGTTTLAPLESATLVKLATNTWQLRPAAQPAGLMLITTQTFSAASSVSVNNCFTSVYDNYRVVVRGTGSAGAWWYFRMRSSGSDNTANSYYSQYISADGATLASLRSQSTYGIAGSGATSAGNGYSFDLYRPFAAVETAWTGLTMYAQSNAYLRVDAGRHAVATSYDGITIYPDSGTISGVIRIYGYRD